MTAQARPVFGLGVTLDCKRVGRGEYVSVYRTLQNWQGMTLLCVLPPVLTGDDLVIEGHSCAYCLGVGRVIGGNECEACRGLGQVRVRVEPGSILPFVSVPPGASDDRVNEFRTPGSFWYVSPSDDLLVSRAPWWTVKAKGSTVPPDGFGYAFQRDGLVDITQGLKWSLR